MSSTISKSMLTLTSTKSSTNSYYKLMNYYTTLVTQIEQIQSSGKQVKLTKLPSVINIKRKPIKF